jgi:hypothetical protein
MLLRRQLDSTMATPAITAALMVNGGLFADAHTHPWLVQTWLPGIIATDADPGGSVAFAEDPDPNRPAVPSPARAG